METIGPTKTKNPGALAPGLYLNLILKLKLKLPPPAQGQQPDRSRHQQGCGRGLGNRRPQGNGVVQVDRVAGLAQIPGARTTDAGRKHAAVESA